MPPIHSSAAAGFQSAADTYARGRPDYPDEVGMWLTQQMGLGPGKTAIDLGAGTGKFTTRLVATGASIVAIEPVAAMRARLVDRLPEVTALNGSAESMPLPDAAADTVVCAQAFHWFASGAALTEIRRVLKPNGVLGLTWNTMDETVPWVDRLKSVLTPYEGDTPRFHTGAWRNAFPHSGFEPLREQTFTYTHTGPPEQVVIDRMMSISFIAALPQEQRGRVMEKFSEIIATEPALAGRDTIAFPYVTYAYTTRAR